MKKEEQYDKIFEHKEELTDMLIKYWQQYSNMGTWYFWGNVSILLIPLIVLFFTIDKKRLFEIAFFGYTTHVVLTYIDIILSMNNYVVPTPCLFSSRLGLV